MQINFNELSILQDITTLHYMTDLLKRGNDIDINFFNKIIVEEQAFTKIEKKVNDFALLLLNQGITINQKLETKVKREKEKLICAILTRAREGNNQIMGLVSKIFQFQGNSSSIALYRNDFLEIIAMQNNIYGSSLSQSTVAGQNNNLRHEPVSSSLPSRPVVTEEGRLMENKNSIRLEIPNSKPIANKNKWNQEVEEEKQMLQGCINAIETLTESIKNNLYNNRLYDKVISQTPLEGLEQQLNHYAALAVENEIAPDEAIIVRANQAAEKLIYALLNRAGGNNDAEAKNIILTLYSKTAKPQLVSNMANELEGFINRHGLRNRN